MKRSIYLKIKMGKVTLFKIKNIIFSKSQLINFKRKIRLNTRKGIFNYLLDIAFI